MAILSMLLAVVATRKPLITGQVLLSSGQPAAQAFLVRQSFGQGVSRSWTNRLDCDSEGRFSFPDDSPLATQIHAYSVDMKESLIKDIPKIQDSRRLDFQLRPSCELSLTFTAGGEPGTGTVMLSVWPNLNLPWLGYMDSHGKVNVVMPQGKYNINVHSDDCDFEQRTVDLKAGKQDISIEGTPNPFRKLKGQFAPELEILDTIGMPRTTRIKDFRGKFVLLEFWGYWCKPCVEDSMPYWIKFLKTHPGIEGKLKVIAVHENSGGMRKMEEIKKHLPVFEEKFWRGKLPFPIMLEKAASLTAKYGVRAYPTAVLIDPDGKVIDRADAETVRQALGMDKETSMPTPRIEK